MKLQITCIFVTLLALHEIGVDVSASSSISKDPFRGISPEDEKLYKSSDVIKCKDGSKKFTRAQLNDDFCDCPDGTDEPGTSACPGGKFYCRNVGHVPVSLFSSRVNDGICDCCDGSDEYDGKVKCQNTCWEAGKVAREKLRKKIATYQEGVTIRKQEVEKAKLAIAKDEEELSRLKNEEKILKGLVEQLKEHKDEIEKAEEEERLQKEKEEKERKEAEEKAIREKTKTEGGTEQEEKEAETSAGIEDKDEETIDHDKVGLLEDLPSDQDVDKNQDTSPDVGKDSDTTKDEKLQDNGAEQHVVGEKEQSVMATKKEEPVSEAGNDVSSSQNHAEGNDVSEDTVGLSKEELGRLIASRWTGEKVEKGDKEGSSENNDHEETPTNTLDEEEDDYVSETDEETDDKKYEYDDLEDETPTDFQEEYHDDSSSHEPESNDDTDLTDISTLSNPSWLAKIQQTVRKIFKAVNLIRTPVDKSDAARVRSEYESASSKLSKIQSRISKLSDKLKHDFGREKEFYSFHGHCFESKQNKYTYKVCPFKDASQEEGYSRTRLGEWDKFDDSYRVVIFANGDKCWNGPDRSLKVKLRCGVSNEVTDVDEPSRCEYIAILSTPALCLEDKLKELQHKLDLMNKEQPSGHDEL